MPSASLTFTWDTDVQGWAATGLNYQSEPTAVGGAIQINWTGGYSGSQGVSIYRQIPIASSFQISPEAKIIGISISASERYVASTNNTAIFLGTYSVSVRAGGTTTPISATEVVIPQRTIDKTNTNWVTGITGSTGRTPPQLLSNGYDGEVGTNDLYMTIRAGGDWTKSAATGTFQFDDYVITLDYLLSSSQLVGVPM